MRNGTAQWSANIALGNVLLGATGAGLEKAAALRLIDTDIGCVGFEVGSPWRGIANVRVNAVEEA